MTATGRRLPGRPRDEQARVSVLQATLELLREDPAAASIDAIARRAGVSRPLIYRWWPDRAALALDALLAATAEAAPYPDSGDPRRDIGEQMRAYVGLLSGPLGPAYRFLIAAAQLDPAAGERLRDHLIEPRRQQTRAVLERAVRSGVLRPDTDLEAAIDQLYAPLIYRLLVGHAPLDDGAVDVLVRQAFDGIGEGSAAGPHGAAR